MKGASSCGISGIGETPQAQPEEAHRPPHGKRAACNENQPTPLKATKFTKTAFFYKLVNDSIFFQ
ncbi:hypothetical protein [Niallia nealsonii]|uniref:Uncharacterized protein n=1 Tax=Niallia nealsonii TaxID=115979 RepID=A0A2N0Z4N1_9BACI|nr:hypothetical protein [Niallia nealsonii]PKG24449.1 hypothetical protein CWS01_06505 [Niallia nealsonii]